MKRLVFLFLTALLVLSSAVTCNSVLNVSAEDDWAMFHHDRVHSGYSTSSSPESNQILWSYAANGSVGSPAVANGRVFFGSRNGTVYCLNAFNGVFLWSFQTDGEVEACPAVVENRVYIGSAGGGVYCLDAVTGVQMWNYSTKLYSVRSSVAVSDGRLYFGSFDGNVYALNAVSGDLLWKFETGFGVYSSPAVSDGKVYVGSRDRNFYCLNSADGTLLWKLEIGNWVDSSPTIADGRVYFGTDGTYLLAVSAADGEVLWKYPTIYGTSGTPAVVEDRVYIGSRDLNVYCFNGTDGSVLWKFRTGAWITCSPAVADGKIYLVEGAHAMSNTGNFYCLDASDGSLIWKSTDYNTGGIGTSSSPAVAYGNVYFGSYDGHLYVFGSSEPSPSPPEIGVISPMNKTYSTPNVTVVFTVNEPFVWAGYSFDGEENVTVAGNFTLVNLQNGLHNVTVYAHDTLGYMGVSETVGFTVAVPEPFPTLTVGVIAVVVVVLVGAGLALHRMKRQGETKMR